MILHEIIHLIFIKIFSKEKIKISIEFPTISVGSNAKYSKKQFIISKIIENYNYNITDSLPQGIKEDYYNCKRIEKEYILSKDKIDKYQNEKRIKVRFTKEEIERYFKGLDKKQIKKYIIDIAKNTRRV